MERFLESEDLERYDIDQKVRDAEEIVEGLDLGEDYWIKPYTDFDGPVRTRGSGKNEYHDGVKEAFDLLIYDEEILTPGIISGRGIGYILHQVDELDLSAIDVAGEMGAVYFPQERLERGVPEGFDPERVVPREEAGKDDIYSFNLKLFEHLAEHNMQFMYGDNVSNVIGSACIEAYGINLDEDRFSVEDTVYEDIYDHEGAQSVQKSIEEAIENYFGGEYADQFEFYNDIIRFEKTEEAAEVLTNVFASKPFIPWGFHDEGDRIAIFPEYRADESFEKEELEKFVSSVLQEFNQDADTEFWYSTYHDNSFDFGKRGYENLKTRAAKEMLGDLPRDENVLFANTGDKISDVFQMDNSLFFAQEGTEAHRYCEGRDIPYIPVENTVESFLILHQLASRDARMERPERPPELKVGE
jgi:hypothetical protein